jgi:hypothetical protein
VKRYLAGLTTAFLATMIVMAAHSRSAPGHTEGLSEHGALARIPLLTPIQNLGLPIYAHLRGSTGSEYILVVSPLDRLLASGQSQEVLDSKAAPGGYLIALERRPGARAIAAQNLEVLLDDGRHLLVRDGPGVADDLAELGFDLQRLPAEPMALHTPELPVAPQITYDPQVAAMIGQVQEGALNAENGNLSGESPITVGGASYTITTRHTSSGTPIEIATQYAYERMQAMGLTVSYHDWSACSRTNRNVIGAKTGTTKPNDIVVISAHLDNMPATGQAPGADDNAAGSAAVLLAANILSPHFFERTVRFILFTGEEQGLCGSEVYAGMAASAGENIVAAYNMDMLGWDAVGGPVLRLHTRLSGNPGYAADVAIANLFSDVVNTYGLSSVLTPIITADGEVASDHYSFWHHGFPGVLAIEDDYDDLNPNYHTADDQRQYLNMGYFTNFVKASLGTAVHLLYPADGPVNYNLGVLKAGTGGGVVHSAPDGIDCGSDCSFLFLSGTPVSLTAVASAGSTFTGWTGCDATEGTVCHLTLTADRTVTAAFALPAVSIKALDPTAGEPGRDKGKFVVSRKGDLSQELTVFYSVKGTAQNGVDYKKLPGKVTIPRGKSSIAVTVYPKDDKVRERNESVKVILKKNAAYELEAPMSAVVTIGDND